MISVSKYNEIMEHIELTEEMRERIIGNIEAEQRRKRIRIVTGVCAAAAACAVVVAGLAVMNGREQLPQEPVQSASSVTTAAPVTTTSETETETAAPDVSEPDEVSTGDSSAPDEVIYYAPEEFPDAGELSKAFGIEMHDVEMPFEVTEKTYLLLFGSIAEITYIGADGEMCYIRTGKTEEDISGDFNEYDTEEEREVNGITLTLKGYDGESYNICSWVKDGHFGCICFDNGLSENEMLDIAGKIIAA